MREYHSGILRTPVYSETDRSVYIYKHLFSQEGELNDVGTNTNECQFAYLKWIVEHEKGFGYKFTLVGSHDPKLTLGVKELPIPDVLKELGLPFTEVVISRVMTYAQIDNRIWAQQIRDKLEGE